MRKTFFYIMKWNMKIQKILWKIMKNSCDSYITFNLQSTNGISSLYYFIDYYIIIDHYIIFID